MPFSAMAREEDDETLQFSISIDEPTVVDRIMYAALQRIGYEVTFEATGMTNAIEIANSGEKDGLYSQSAGIEEKYPNLVMVPESNGSVKFEAYALKGAGIKINSWGDFKGLRVGTVFQKPYIHGHLPGDIQTLVQKDNVPLLIQALLDGECDVIVMSNSLNTDVLVPEQMEKAGLADRIMSFAYLNKKYAYLSPAIAEALREMKADGTFDKISSQEKDEATNEKVILHISSYNTDMAWEKELREGIEEVFAYDTNAHIYTVSLDANRYRSVDGSARNVITGLRASMLKNIPDVVIVSDNEAMEFILNYYGWLFTNVPVVFCAADSFDAAGLWKLEGNATGITKAPAARDTAEMMLELFPDTRTIYVVNDYTSAGRIWQREIDEQLASVQDWVHIVHNEDVPFSELAATIGELPADALLLTGFYYVDGDGVTYAESSIHRRMAEASPVPIFGLMDMSIGYGQTGGKYTDGKAQGRWAGEAAKRIIEGADADAIGIEPDAQAYNRWMFDYNSLQNWDIDTRKLPEGAAIINRAPTLRESNPVLFYVLIVFSGVALLAILLLSRLAAVQKRQNQKLLQTQKSLHTAEELLGKESEIREMNARLEKMLESAPLVYMLLIDRMVVETNTYLRDNLDVPVGVDISDYMPAEEIETLREALLQDGFVYGAIHTFKTKSGERHRFHINLAAVEHEGRYATVVWGIDIEESEKQRDSLARMQNELLGLIDSVPAPIFICDPDEQRIHYANQSFIDMFEFGSREEALGTRMTRFSPEVQPDGENTATKLRNYIGQVLASRDSFPIEWLFVLPSGNEIYAHIKSDFLIYNDYDYLVVTMQDMAAERKREELLIQAAEKERVANRMKSMFLMNMSHEIRTPMNAIIGFSQLAMQSEQSDANMDAFKKINISANNLLGIINDILDFSKIEAEKLDLLEEEFDLEEVLSNAFMVASERIGDKKIEMLMDVHPNVPYSLIGDRTRVWQVLKNLLDNSAKYTERGRVILRVDTFEGSAKGDEIMFRFVVEDTGLGMDKEQMQRLFIPFEQFHNSARNNQTGTGLGMSITKQLVGLMQGNIHVDSEAGVGTRTTVLLPLKRGSANTTMRQRISAGKISADTVLIADDDEYARSIMESILRSINVTAICVPSGDDALQKAKEYNDAGKPFKIIILDYLLGNDNGIEVAKRMHDITDEHSKLLMVSAYSKQLLRKEIEGAGFNGIIEKPFVPSAFVQKLCDVMQIYGDEPAKPARRKFTGARVLVCEDNLFNQEVAKGMLGIFGIEPALAKNGEEALNKLAAEPFDLVFMDIMMPVMDGHAATVAIRNSDAPYKDVAIVAMTANVMADEVQRCHDEGMNAHIGKPMDMEQVYQCLLSNLPAAITNETPAAPETPSHAQSAESFALTLAGIDTAGGIARFGGFEEKYLETLLRFGLSLADMFPPNFATALAEEDGEALRRGVHTLKGAASNLGVDALANEAAAFEGILLEKQADAICYASLMSACKAANNIICSELGSRLKARRPAAVKGQRELLELLAEIQRAFDSAKLGHCTELIDSIAEARWEVDAEILKGIKKLIDEYDFEAATELLARSAGEAHHVK